MHVSIRTARIIAAACALLAGCTSATKVEPQPEFVGYIEENIMPNTRGFSPVSEGPAYLQGSWYFYDDGVRGHIDELYFAMDGKKYYLYPVGGGERPSSTSESSRVSEVVVNGVANEYLAVGFEVCSTRKDEEPFEFPFVLGHCTLVNNGPFETDGAAHFLGISFEFIPDDRFSRIEVLFKQWGSEDDADPYCVVYPRREEDRETVDAAKCESVPNEDGTGYLVYAEARRARSDLVDTPVNIAMLQAIHLEVYREPTMEGNDVSFTLRNVKVRSAVNPQSDIGKVKTLETDCTMYDTAVEAVEDYEPGWVAPVDWHEVSYGEPFLIMREEVSVAQYRDCIDAGVCAGVGLSVPAWETCNVALYENVSGQARTDLEEKAANCVGWCHAKRFCEWIGGRLPTEAQWQIAAWRALDGSDLPTGLPRGVSEGNCEYAVINDPVNGVGCGDRMPAAGCTKVSPAADPNDLCDMAGNLWEWVEDEAEVDGDTAWRTGYRKLKGGSLNSSQDSVALNVDASTIEHPVVPRSPTRLGFRCVKPSPD